MCKSWCEAIIAIVVIVVGFLVTNPTWAKWTLVVVGLGLLVHSFTCKTCFTYNHEMSSEKKGSSRKK